MINVSFANVHLCRKWDVLMCVGGLQKLSLFRFFSGNSLSGSATNTAVNTSA